MSFPTDQQILNDPNVWIGDTGATVHMTPHKNGIANVRKGSKNDAVTMGNEQVEVESHNDEGCGSSTKRRI
jgi:hypothetical protein